jgi:O-6-methylguanine DNA methyltransferase
MKSSIILLSTAEFQKLMQNQQPTYQYYSYAAGFLKASICSLGVYELHFIEFVHEVFQPLESITQLVLVGTSFQHQVWQHTLQIPVGTTISYHQLAQAIGKPKAYRAVANALGANKLLYVVPCHRIIGKNGSLTGFRWGIELKKRLLESERIINNV